MFNPLHVETINKGFQFINSLINQNQICIKTYLLDTIIKMVTIKIKYRSFNVISRKYLSVL